MQSDTYSQEDYAALQQGLLPPGRAWTRRQDSNLYKVLFSRALGYKDINAQVKKLLIEAIPTTSTELLPDWERVTGLEGNAGLTDQERRDAIVAKLALIGSLAPVFIIAAAAAAGYTIEIREFQRFEVGRSVVGDPLSNGDWVYAFEIIDGVTFVSRFQVGIGVVGDRLVTYTNIELQILIDRIKPANSIVVYNLLP